MATIKWFRAVSKKDNRINIRLTDDELRRLQRLYAKGLEQSKGHATKANMVRELIGFLPPNLFTEKDRLSLKADEAEKEVKKTGSSGRS